MAIGNGFEKLMLFPLTGQLLLMSAMCVLLVVEKAPTNGAGHSDLVLVHFWGGW